MPTILRATDQNMVSAGVAFNFDDLAVQARQYLDQVRAEAAKILAEARREAAALRVRVEQETQQEAHRAAMASMEQVVARQLSTVLPALHRAADELNQARHAWLNHWEAGGVHVAAAIARRLIRRELLRQPDIPVALIREALTLAAGNPQVRLHLNPDDRQALGGQVDMLVRELAGLGETQIIADPAITPGGCRVETQFGSIDQQIEAQLARVEEELAQ